MTNAAKLLAEQPVRALVVGYPKAGKTASLASLVNAGFKLRMIDFDGNADYMIRKIKPERLVDVDIVTLEDKLRQTDDGLEPDGIPDAFAKGVKLMDHWKYKDPDGEEVDLGRSKDWGPDVIVAMDSLTANGKASLRRATKLSNKTSRDITDRVYNLAIGEQEKWIDRLTSSNNKHHVLVLAHLKMITPKDVRRGDSKIAQDVKEEIAAIMSTKLYPSALGYQWPQFIGGEFPAIIQAKSVVRGGKLFYVLDLMPREELDLGVPALDLPKELPSDTGMLTIFEALTPSSVKLVREQLKQGVPLTNE